ncbi:MAG: 1-acyl-sn-glycerol-3-phosphate acyltransferase [Dehalococcoidia bacterium]
MARYIVLSKLSAESVRRVKSDPNALLEARELVAGMDGKVIEQRAVLGEYDFFSIIEAPDNAAAQMMGVEQSSIAGTRHVILPAIDMDLFIRLLGQTTETVGPHSWQIRVPAQVGRRALRWHAVTRHVREACKPLTVDGREHLKGVKGPAIFIANHSSHLDSLVVIQALPERVRRRLAFGSAADRFFITGRKGMTKQPWWNSLALNCFPIKRGGGKATLDYAKWLLGKGWNVMIFPEGTRSTTGRLAHFRHGVSILALDCDVPVVPMYLDGLREIRPKGTKDAVPGPVTALIGEPIRFEAGTEVPEATKRLHRPMEGRRGGAGGERPAREHVLEPETAPAGAR